ncbi:hypothetical protein DRE_06755 [Drechslerella stenobrocha 248]|uniref:Uncharacterized protein n=1 Tax=Drechslerella stenobrocha 248 TaxID=1043628 RepID=W7HWQ5_9PEZI|nr:hypothetical protein DRE_06755 [Drechslerella stenobrocha 248]
MQIKSCLLLAFSVLAAAEGVCADQLVKLRRWSIYPVGHASAGQVSLNQYLVVGTTKFLSHSGRPANPNFKLRPDAEDPTKLNILDLEDNILRSPFSYDIPYTMPTFGGIGTPLKCTVSESTIYGLNPIATRNLKCTNGNTRAAVGTSHSASRESWTSVSDNDVVAVFHGRRPNPCPVDYPATCSTYNIHVEY